MKITEILTSKVLKDESICVDIILATYNGEKYLTEFLDSILHQSYQNWLLLISDDDSTDATVSIINNYHAQDARISLVNTKRQGGVVQNFAKCLTYSSSPYIMFADQDDIWLPDKIAISLHKLIDVEIDFGQNHPILIFTDLTLVNQKLDTISESFYKYNNLDPLNNTYINYLCWRSSVFGCSVIFNKALKEKVGKIDERAMMHDHIFALAATLLGTIAYLDQPTVFYRQHEGNVIGGAKKSILHKISNIKFYLHSLLIYRAKIETQLNFIQEQFPNTSFTLHNQEVKTCQSKVIEANFSSLHSRFSFIINFLMPYIYEKPLSTILLAVLIVFA